MVDAHVRTQDYGRVRWLLADTYSCADAALVKLDAGRIVAELHGVFSDRRGRASVAV